MKRLQAFKFQLRPGDQQECEMKVFAGACRFVFNRAWRFRMRIMRPVINTSLTGKMASWRLSGKMPTETNGLKILPHSHCNSH
ncbi:helix-turn-helix domain-containing protein [Escherichia coli]